MQQGSEKYFAPEHFQMMSLVNTASLRRGQKNMWCHCNFQMMSLVKIPPLRSGQKAILSNTSRGDMSRCPNVLPSLPQRASPCGFRISSAVVGAMPASRPSGCAPFRAADVSEHRWPIVLAHGGSARVICMVARFGAHGFLNSGPAPQERGSFKLKLFIVGARRFL